MSEGETHEGRISKVEGELSRVIAAMDSLVKSIESIRSEISADVKTLGDRLATRTAPNFGIMASWAGVTVGVIGLLMSPTAVYFGREFARLERTTRELDDKLQHEQVLIKDALASATGANEKRIEQIEAWTQGQIKSDLDELRRWREGRLGK